MTESGALIEGVTDEEGYTKPIYTEQQEIVNFHLLDKYTYTEEEQ